MDETRTVPAWLPGACLVVSGLGLLVSGYLAFAHYTSPEVLACSATGIVNCERVTTSHQSVFLGIPVALLGLLFFAGSLVLNLPAAWEAPSKALRWVRLAAVSVGMVFVLWLIYAEIYIIGSICLWCTVVHVLTFILFCLVLWGTIELTVGEEEIDGFEEPEED